MRVVVLLLFTLLFCLSDRADSAECRDGFTLSRSSDRCFKVIVMPRKKLISYAEGNQMCRKLGKNVRAASVHSQGEMVSLLHQIRFATLTEYRRDRSYKPNAIYIGLRSRNTVENRSWEDRTPLDFTNWGKNKPNNKSLCAGACVVVRLDGSWDDWPCQFASANGIVCVENL